MISSCFSGLKDSCCGAIAAVQQGCARAASCVAGVACAGGRAIRAIEGATINVAGSLHLLTKAIKKKDPFTGIVATFQAVGGAAALTAAFSLFPNFGQRDPIHESSFYLLQTSLLATTLVELSGMCRMILSRRKIGTDATGLKHLSLEYVFGPSRRHYLKALLGTSALTEDVLKRIRSIFAKQGVYALAFSASHLALSTWFINGRKGPIILLGPLALTIAKFLRAAHHALQFRDLEIDVRRASSPDLELGSRSSASSVSPQLRDVISPDLSVMDREVEELYSSRGSVTPSPTLEPFSGDVYVSRSVQGSPPASSLAEVAAAYGAARVLPSGQFAHPPK